MRNDERRPRGDGALTAGESSRSSLGVPGRHRPSSSASAAARRDCNGTGYVERTAP